MDLWRTGGRHQAEHPCEHPPLLEAVQRGSGHHPGLLCTGIWKDKVWTQAHSHQGAPRSFLFLVVCVTSLARARRRLMRSFCDVTAARCWLLLPLTPGWRRFFVIKGLNIPSNPLAGHTAALLPRHYPRWTPMVSSHELCGVAIWNGRTGLLFSCSESEKAVWEELEEADAKLKAFFSYSLPHLILRVNISTVLLPWQQCKAAQSSSCLWIWTLQQNTNSDNVMPRPENTLWI